MLIQIENVCKTFLKNRREVPAVSGASMQLDAGQFVAIFGPSGCGKSTFLLMAGGLMRPTDGDVVFEGVNVYDHSVARRARFRVENIGFVFQQYHLIPYLTVLDNVLAASLGLSNGSARQRSGLRDRGMELVERFGLADRTDHIPSELSAGECQRVALARAMLNRPKVLLADEPTGNLDSENGAMVLGQLAECARTGAAVLLVTHDAQAAKFAGQIVHMDRGRFPAAVTGGDTP